MAVEAQEAIAPAVAQAYGSGCRAMYGWPGTA